MAEGLGDWVWDEFEVELAERFVCVGEVLFGVY